MPVKILIAFFEGVFYESHQERVGNIAFQDYLIYTDKAVYFWARGSSKDYLDRFNLGSVSLNSRNKDHDFATLNFKVRREDKEPVYVIFDMVELKEAEVITRLHTVIESIIEERFGLDYRKNLPDDVSQVILQDVRSVCVPQVISVRFDAHLILLSGRAISVMARICLSNIRHPSVTRRMNGLSSRLVAGPGGAGRRAESGRVFSG